MFPPISAFVFGVPVGQPRPRARRFKDRVIIYDPKTAKPWREAVANTLREMVDSPLEGPLELTMTFAFPRPKSHYGTGKNSDRIKGSSPIYHTQKPDIDNVLKSSLDAMNDVLFEDDRQVVQVNAQKTWADLPDLAGLALQVESLLHPEEGSDPRCVEQCASES